MNTKSLMTMSSIILGTVGIFALFAPENLLTLLSAPIASPLPTLIQMLGALYFSMSLINWTAKDSAIGGIYARPVSLGNFSHFFSGMFILGNYLLTKEFNIFTLLIALVYAVLAFLFYWLVFRHTGIVANKTQL